NRQTAADINPYIAMATTLAAGLWGLERRADPPAPVEGDASARGDLAPLPVTLRDAVTRLEASAHARDLLGAGFVDHYLLTRDWECRQYDRAVTEWELERYFETVRRGENREGAEAQRFLGGLAVGRAVAHGRGLRVR